MWEFGRRGYLKFGGYIPEVVLDHPELVEVMHEEFVHAGTDVVEAFTVRSNNPYKNSIKPYTHHFITVSSRKNSFCPIFSNDPVFFYR